MIQRVFFDLGLTLAESDVPQGYVEHLARLGHPVSLEEAQRAYHLANKFFMRERQGALGKGSKEVLRDFLARVCQELGIPQLGEDLFRLTLEDRRPAHWSAFPFSLEVLRGLRGRGNSHGPGVQLGYLLQERAGADRFGPLLGPHCGVQRGGRGKAGPPHL